MRKAPDLDERSSPLEEEHPIREPALADQEEVVFLAGTAQGEENGEDGEDEEVPRRVWRDVLGHLGDGHARGRLVMGDGERAIVLAEMRPVVGQVEAGDGEGGPHDVVAREAHLDDGNSVEVPDDGVVVHGRDRGRGVIVQQLEVCEVQRVRPRCRAGRRCRRGLPPEKITANIVLDTLGACRPLFVALLLLMDEGSARIQLAIRT